MWHLTPVHLQVGKMKAGLKQLHADLAASTPGTPVTEADLTWAIQAVRSRAFSGPYAGAPLCVTLYYATMTPEQL